MANIYNMLREKVIVRSGVKVRYVIVLLSILSALFVLAGCGTEEKNGISRAEAEKTEEIAVLRKNNLYALDVDSGDLLWYRKLQEQHVAVTEMTGDLFFAGTHVFDRTTGELLAKTEKEGSRYVGGTADYLLKVAEKNEKEYVLCCLDWDEEIRWRHPGGVFLENVTIENDTVFLSDEKGLAALDLDSGKEKWRFPAEGVRLKTIINNNYVAVGIIEPHPYLRESRSTDFERFIVILDRKSGEEIWKLDFSAVPIGIDEDRLYLSFREEIGVYSISTQEKIWKYRFSEIISGSIWAASDNQFIYANISLDNEKDGLFCLDTESGEIVWKTEGNYFLLPVPGDELVYIGTHMELPPKVIAFKKCTGNEAWRFEIEVEEEGMGAKLEPIFIIK